MTSETSSKEVSFCGCCYCLKRFFFLFFWFFTRRGRVDSNHMVFGSKTHGNMMFGAAVCSDGFKDGL